MYERIAIPLVDNSAVDAVQANALATNVSGIAAHI
jgi:hypothetical protein